MTRRNDEVVLAGVRDEEARTAVGTGPARLLNRVRQALFEATPAIQSDAGIAPIATQEDPALVSSAMGTLRELITRDTGPALSEFNLQVEAVRELVLDPAMRLRIALSVLARKSISRQSLEQDLSRVASLLGQQMTAFAEKVEARRRENAAEVERVEAECRDARAHAEHEIAALEAALTRQRGALAQAGTTREKRIAELNVTRNELDQKERAFRDAQARLLGEYEALGRDLTELATEKL